MQDAPNQIMHNETRAVSPAAAAQEVRLSIRNLEFFLWQQPRVAGASTWICRSAG